MKILTEAREIEEALVGKKITNICHATNNESIEIYFTNGSCICIEGEHIDYLDVNAQLEVEVRVNE